MISLINKMALVKRALDSKAKFKVWTKTLKWELLNEESLHFVFFGKTANRLRDRQIWDTENIKLEPCESR